MWTAPSTKATTAPCPTSYGHLAILETLGGGLPARAASRRRRAASWRRSHGRPRSDARLGARAWRSRTSVGSPKPASLGERDLASDLAIDYESAVALHHRSLGVTELFAGQAEFSGNGTSGEPSRSRATRSGSASQPSCGCTCDAVAALSCRPVTPRRRSGSPLSSTRAATANQPALGHRHGRSTATARSVPRRRCRPQRSQSLESAVEAHEQLRHAVRAGPHPPSVRARCCVSAGRRADARRAAQEAAHAAFARLGTPVQAARRPTPSWPPIGGPSRSDRTAGPDAHRAPDRHAWSAAGQTSREVADALFMSVRTVDTHLGHIYRKLGAPVADRARRLAGQPAQSADVPGPVAVAAVATVGSSTDAARSGAAPSVAERENRRIAQPGCGPQPHSSSSGTSRSTQRHTSSTAPSPAVAAHLCVERPAPDRPVRYLQSVYLPVRRDLLLHLHRRHRQEAVRAVNDDGRLRARPDHCRPAHQR